VVRVLGIGLEIGIADLNQIADLKPSILAPIQIADLNLTPCIGLSATAAVAMTPPMASVKETHGIRGGSRNSA